MPTNNDNDFSLPRAAFAMPAVIGLVVITSLAMPGPLHRLATSTDASAATLVNAEPIWASWPHDDGATVRLVTLEPVGDDAARPPPWETIEPPRTREAAGELLAAFLARGYSVESLRDLPDPVAPRVRVMRLPDLSGLAVASDRRALFIKALLPLILAENQRIEADRARLAALAAQINGPDAPAPDDAEFLRALGQRYDTRPDDFAELLRRVDIIPVSMAIAQAAVESGWGTSYGARIMQALFGQMAGTRLRAFPDLPSAVEAYVLNLNRHRAYTRFRQARAQMRERGEFDVLELVAQLAGYSELGEAYTRYLRGLMRENDLQRFDRVRLAG